MSRRRSRKAKRLFFISVAGGIFAVAVALVLFALNDQIVFFQTPTNIVEDGLAPGIKVRVGGLVEEDSLIRNGDTATFAVTDTANLINATYTGILPDLFREGQGIVMEGVMTPSGLFVADTVLAKHDENYMPSEVAEALKQQGVWQGDLKDAP